MRTVMMREQNRIRAPKIVVAVQTDAYGVVMFSYPLECKFFGGPCIDDCKRYKQVAMAWKPHQKRIEELLGRKPVAPEPTIFDTLQMLGAMMGRR